MAIWQFRVDLVPERVIRSKCGTLPITIPKDMAENFIWWSEVQPPTGFEAWIAAVLPEANSWSKSMRIWGDERGDTASVCYKDDTKRTVEWIGFRVDVRQLSPRLVKDICVFAERLGCMLLTGSYHLLPPMETELLAAIDHSTATKYVQNPVSTLQGFKQNEAEIIHLPKKKDMNGAPPADA